MRQPPRIELRPRFESLDPPGLPLEVLVCAVEEEGDKRADLVAQGGLGGGEGRLGDQFVVLFIGALVILADVVRGECGAGWGEGNLRGRS